MPQLAALVMTNQPAWAKFAVKDFNYYFSSEIPFL
jgi:hypothetical protein